MYHCYKDGAGIYRMENKPYRKTELYLEEAKAPEVKIEEIEAYRVQNNQLAMESLRGRIEKSSKLEDVLG